GWHCTAPAFGCPVSGWRIKCGRWAWNRYSRCSRWMMKLLFRRWASGIIKRNDNNNLLAGLRVTTENLPQLPPPPAQVLPSKSRIWPLWLLSLALVVALAVLAWLGWQQLQLRDSQLTGLQTMVQQQQRQLEQLDER